MTNKDGIHKVVNPDKVLKVVLREDHSVVQRVVKAREPVDHRGVANLEKVLPPTRVTKVAAWAAAHLLEVVAIVAVIWDLLPVVARVAACKLALSIY